MEVNLDDSRLADGNANGLLDEAHYTLPQPQVAIVNLRSALVPIPFQIASYYPERKAGSMFG